MSEPRDPAIKLFGRTIPLQEEAPPPPPAAAAAAASEQGSDVSLPPDTAREVDKVMFNETEDMKANNEKPDAPEVVEHTEAKTPSSAGHADEDSHQANNQDDKSAAVSKAEEDGVGQEKVLKKPDKILPCPRCNSMDTKFCYYNNYNINQPRHFCKNCQRYWTAGGAMRNVPVGAGRRKNKNSASQYRHIMMPDGVVAGRADVPELIHHQALSPAPSVPTRPVKVNGTVLNFGLEVPLCESTSMLNIEEQHKHNDFHSMPCGENREEHSCASSVTPSKPIENGLPESQAHCEQNGIQGYTHGVHAMPQCYLGPPFMYPWSLGWNNIAAVMAGRHSSEHSYGSENGSPSSIPWVPPPVMPAPGFCATTVPFPLMPASFWGCWNAPWLGSNGTVSPSSSTTNSGCSGNGSPILGKHSRDSSSLQGEEKKEKSLWVPKTLRIHDPDAAAKSSIWATLGIKPNEKGVFKPFRSTSESKDQTSDAAQVLQANPAALSRSQSFQESS